MAEMIIGIFHDSKDAGNVVSEFKSKGVTDEITVVAKESIAGDTKVHEIQKDVSEGATAGAVAGATVGGLAGLLTGVASFVVPGVGLLVFGPLATVLTGIAGGALSGGLVGALVDYGIPEEKAKLYEQRLQAGEVIVGVTTGHMNANEVMNIMNQHNAEEISVVHTK
ncbi:MAG TPA: DUF1269 domain-containing protein [Candidatus Woesebacteria bacterium]|nr:DUF1269 domain-containing protein [Candidatus Woesebacteria bacterium]